MRRLLALVVFLVAVSSFCAEINPPYAPDRRPDEGEGPFERLILRGATLIDGTGAPPIGPVDIVIEKNRIREIRSVGCPKVARSSRAAGRRTRPRDRPPRACTSCRASSTCTATSAARSRGRPAEYVFKLWMAHGITTVREPGCGNGVDWTLHEGDAARATRSSRRASCRTSSPARAVGRRSDQHARAGAQIRPVGAKKGIAGPRSAATAIQFFGYRPDIIAALLDEAKKQGLAHRLPPRADGRRADQRPLRRALGLRGMEHWYGLPEALFADRTIQDYPAGYNYNDEQDRFGQAGRLWKQAAPPGSEKWNAVMDELMKLDFNIDPTFTIYEASRDLMRARRAEWHDEYTLPSLWDFYQPSRAAHGVVLVRLDDRDEIEWKKTTGSGCSSSTSTRTAAAGSRPAATPASSTSSTASTTSASWSCCRKPASIRWK